MYTLLEGSAWPRVPVLPGANCLIVAPQIVSVGSYTLCLVTNGPRNGFVNQVDLEMASVGWLFSTHYSDIIDSVGEDTD
jgi:hypothetical protein